MALSLEQYRSYYLSEEDSTIKVILAERIEEQRKRSNPSKGIGEQRKRLKVCVSHGNRIPDHLITEILSWLPVRTLLLFKSVCKSWYAMIKSPQFISEHLRNYYNNNSNWRDCLIVQYSTEYSMDTNLHVYELLISNKRNEVLSYEEINSPINNAYFCGPCDGIYYLSRYCNPKRSMWNPALNELKILPDISWKPRFAHDCMSIRESYGFGYDSKTKDYKVILIKLYEERDVDYPMWILIYSLKTNRWRHWGYVDKAYYLGQNYSYVFVNGCYHWIGSLSHYRSYDKLITFDISEELYKEIPLPQFKKKRNDCRLVVYHDAIGFVIVHDHHDFNKSSFRVWTLNEEVWTQKLKLKLDYGVYLRGGSFCQWRDDSLVFGQGHGKLTICDRKTKKLFDLDDPQAGEVEHISVYKESLVSINDFK